MNGDVQIKTIYIQKGQHPLQDSAPPISGYGPTSEPKEG